MLNIYEKFSLKPVINGSGKMTILGVSTIDEDVAEALIEGATNFFVMKDLLHETGKYIADLLHVEAALPVASASAGIAQTVASLITKDRLQDILNLHRVKENLSREIIVAKGHNVNYGVPVATMVELGGGKVVEAGYGNECKKEHIESLITPHTVGLLYIKSHHCVQKSMASIEEYVSISKKYEIPLIVDAAAEEDLTKYYKMGANMVIYSGAKALEGPTSGLVIGQKKYIDNLTLQGQGIGRAMKIGKENVLGLTKAIEKYLVKDSASVVEIMKKKVETLNALFSNMEKVSARMVQDPSGRDIYRSELTFDSSIDVVNLTQKLKEGDTAIYTRDYHANEGRLEIDVRSVTNDQLQVIYNSVKNLM